MLFNKLMLNNEGLLHSDSRTRLFLVSNSLGGAAQGGVVGIGPTGIEGPDTVAVLAGVANCRYIRHTYHCVENECYALSGLYRARPEVLWGRTRN